MKILLIRHGTAEDRGTFEWSAKKDAARALTQSGRRDMRKAAKGLRKVAPDIDVLATSPLVRARETAEIVGKVFGVDDLAEQPLLAPGGDADALLTWLHTQPTDAAVALVGHEPDLSRFAGFLLARAHASFVALKKGGSALIEFDDTPAAGRGVLAWLLQPGHLRKLSG